MDENLIASWSHDYDDYLHDESKRAGMADSISFPRSEDEVAEVIRRMRAAGGPVTIQGARTGIVAGAVPQGGHILNLSRMNGISEVRREGGNSYLMVQPAAALEAVREALAKEDLFFPPDPTEASASIGGMVASNASGAMSFHYGATRKWIESLRVVLSDGSIVHLKRGESFAEGRAFSVVTEDGKSISGHLPSYIMPDVKSAAGYYVADDMDMLDLFIGMEGTLGVVTEIELRLIPKPGAMVGLTMFLPSEEAALTLVRVLRGEDVEGFQPPAIQPVAIEFFNSNALDLLREMRSESSAFSEIPALKPHYHTAINVEFHGESEEELEAAVMQVMEDATELGASDEDTWYATTEREMEPLKAFRHAVPEAVNLLIGERKKTQPELIKLGTDMSVPDQYLEQVIGMYDSELKEAELESVVFGHIGNNHVHVNILPRDMGEYEKGKSLYLSWAERVIALGGSVSAEHGIGKIKAPFLKMMYGEEGIAEMRELKKLFDPEMTLNPGNLF